MKLRYKTRRWRPLVFCAALLCAACENVTGPEEPKNSDAAILSFSIGEAVGAISGTGIALWLPLETDRTSLVPEITLSRGATISPPAGTARDFSGLLTYTVTAEDGGIQSYTVTVRSASSLNPPAFASLDAMAEYLLAFEGKNNKDTPINIVLSLALETLEGVSHAPSNTSNDWLGAVFDNLNGRYVTLDLSACSGEFMGGTGTAAEILATTRERRDADKLVELIPPSLETGLPDYIFSRIRGLRRVQLHTDMQALSTGAFQDCPLLEEVDCNGAPLTIGERAFSGCVSLERIGNTSGLREIQGYAFENCPALSAESLDALLNPDEPLSLGDYAFAGCALLTSLGQANIDVIGNYAFTNCTNLVSVAIPDSVTTIGAFAFFGCTGITSLSIPDSVTAIGSSAFRLCASLGSSVIIPASVTVIPDHVFAECERIASITIPASITAIGQYAFRGCAGLGSLAIPNSVATIGQYAFAGCAGLSSLAIPNSVTTIGQYAFAGCAGLSSLTIPDSVTNLGLFLFENCTNLGSVSLPNSTFGGNFTYFAGCTSLASVTIPDFVEHIGMEAFRDCAGLTSLTIPASVIEINYFAFAGCTGLTSLTIPASVTLMRAYSLERCTNLQTLNLLRPSSDGITSFDRVFAPADVPALTAIYVPDDDSVAAYKAAPGWSDYAVIIKKTGT